MAAQAEEIKKLKEQLDAHEGPILSAYLSVNPRYNTNQGQAYKIRLTYHEDRNLLQGFRRSAGDTILAWTQNTPEDARAAPITSGCSTRRR